MQVKIRSVGRDSFWSAGRKWTSEGRVVTLVQDDPIPETCLRKVAEGVFELDLPSKDAVYQDWVIDSRKKHDAKDELTASDYAQIRADYKFLAVEFPTLPVFTAVKK